MLRKSLLLTLFIILTSCGASKKKRTTSTTKSVHVEGAKDNPKKDRKASVVEEVSPLANSIIATALTFSGTRYKYGGTTRKGMDCSGLLYVSFLEHDVALPRISYQMANEGSKIKVSEVVPGDLLFFKTSKSGKRINHVGLVVEVDGDDIKFIHSTTSRGVIVSSLREGFWNYSFVKATRIL